MNVSARFLAVIAGLVVAFTVAPFEAKAQPCNAGFITIINQTFLPVDLCIKQQPNCINVPANSTIFVPVPIGTQIPGCYGVANVTYPWSANPFPPPALWIQSLRTNPSGRCFDILFDQPTCTITIRQAPGPPCINP
jgi:hypothetical protein